MWDFKRGWPVCVCMCVSVIITAVFEGEGARAVWNSEHLEVGCWNSLGTGDKKMAMEMEEKNCCLKGNTTKLYVHYPKANSFFF